MSRQQQLAKSWLIRNDPDEGAFWRAQPEGADFVGAVRDNLNTFGPDEMAEFLVLDTSRPTLP